MIPSVLRIAATYLVFSATGVLVAGCGGSGHSSSRNASPPSTKERAAAFARTVNLRASEVPGLLPGTQTEHEANETGPEDEIARCIGVPRQAHEVLRFVSPLLRVGDYRVSSSVAIDVKAPPRTPEIAAEEEKFNKALGGRQGIVCNAQFIARTYTQRGVRNLRVVPLPSPLARVDGAIGFRFRVTGASTNGTQAVKLPPLYQDVVLLNFYGREIELIAEGLHRPCPTPTERRLLTLLYSRAEAHKF